MRHPLRLSPLRRWGVEGCGKYALTHARSLEETAVSGNAVHLDLLVVEKDVVADLQARHGCVDVGTHEVGEVEAVAD